MKVNRFVSRVAGLGLAGALAVGCLSSQRETGTPLSLMARAALAAKADRVVRVIDADTYTSCYRAPRPTGCGCWARMRRDKFARLMKAADAQVH